MSSDNPAQSPIRPRRFDVTLAGDTNLDLLMIKRGAMGASVYRNGRCWHAPVHDVDVVDAVGAGDSFNAGFLHAWIREWPIDKALAFGNRTGAWSASASGGTSAFRVAALVRENLSAWENEFQNAESL
jgi:sugar/nucleoside kinase (ribokinase family)